LAKKVADSTQAACRETHSPGFPVPVRDPDGIPAKAPIAGTVFAGAPCLIIGGPGMLCPGVPQKRSVLLNSSYWE
jgi:hypothetical protein